MSSSPGVSRTSSADDASGSGPHPAWRGRLVSCLTTISHISAPFITTFVLIHLSAPAMGMVGGSSLSSRIMLLGREYYQTPFGEKYLVLAPLVIHPLAGVAKRLFSPGVGFQKPWSQPRPLTSILSSTGYLTLFLFLPVHYLTHRVYPAIPDAPIHSFGPAELDYEFVKTGIQAWPLRSWFLYIGLVGCVALHAVEGISIITALQYGKDVIPRGKRKLLSFIAGIPALTGLFVISTETVWGLVSSMEGYRATFYRSVVYRIL